MVTSYGLFSKVAARRITTGITMLTYFIDEIIGFAPFVLPRNNWSFDGDKTNGVMPADVMRSGSNNEDHH